MSVNWLLYLSRPRDVPWPGVVLDIARVCERDNPAAGITGALLFSNELYLQYLEGPQAALEALWERLARDSRHQIVWSTAGEVPARRLGAFAMGYLDGDREGAPLRDQPLWRLRDRWAPEDAEGLIGLLLSLVRYKYPTSFDG
jgi:hypothetical protein